ncbi:MAG: histidine triad nucleotide-binding protein [Desulfobacterales bacterium]
MEKECIFCNIINRKLPSEFLYEDDTVVVFKDIHPQAPIHLLIVPKKHIRSINDLEEDDKSIVSETIDIAKVMAVKMGISRSGYKLLFNVEKGGGQVIFHLHLHLMGGWRR